VPWHDYVEAIDYSAQTHALPSMFRGTGAISGDRNLIPEVRALCESVGRKES
jgi:hypothetical protein